MTTKLPGLPPVPSNLGPDATAYLKALGEALEVRLGRRGDPIDRAVTLRELVDSGLATQLGHVPFNPDNLGASVDFESAVAPDLSQPPAPTGLTATAAFETVLLEWSNGNLQFRNFAFTEIHRATSNVIGNATLVGVVRGNRFSDTVDSDTTHYYWVRHVSTSDVRGPFNDTAGTVATTQKLEGADIQPLTITNTLIANNAAIDGAKIADLDAAKITTGVLNANRINVDGSSIVANGSGQLQIANLGVGTAQINNAAITAAKIGNGQITNAKLGNASVNTAKIADLNVTRLKIENGAVSNVIVDAYTGSSITFSTNTLTDTTNRVTFTLTANDTFHFISHFGIGLDGNGRTHSLRVAMFYNINSSDPFGTGSVEFHDVRPADSQNTANPKTTIGVTSIGSSSSQRTVTFGVKVLCRVGGGGAAGTTPGNSSAHTLTVFGFTK